MTKADVLFLAGQVNWIMRGVQASVAHETVDHLHTTNLEEWSFNPIEAREYSVKEVWEELYKFILADTNDPLLLVWMGHGTEEGWIWQYRKSVADGLGYNYLLEVLAEAKRPILILNDACGGGALCTLVARDPALSKRVGVIAATSEYGVADGGFMSIEVLSHFIGRLKYRPSDVYCEIPAWKPLRESNRRKLPARFLIALANGMRRMVGYAPVPKRTVIDLRRKRYEYDQPRDTIYPNIPVRAGTTKLDKFFFARA